MKVDSKLYEKEFPSVEEKLVLDLAAAISAKKCPGESVVSWDCQREALDIFNKLGFEGALDRLVAYQGDDDED